MTPEHTAMQRAARSWTALDDFAAGIWRKIDRRTLSFAITGRDPLSQIFGSLPEGLRALGIGPGNAAGLGFAAYDDQDAETLRKAWVLLLITPDDS